MGRQGPDRPVVPGYIVDGVVGHGGSGPVWGGRDQAGRAVVLRVVEGGDRRLAAVRELRAEHLAPVVDVVSVGGGRHAVVSLAVPGPDLATVVAARGRLARPEVATVLVATGRALAALHAHGLVHGDVSPANVLFTPAGAPVLVDLVGDPSSERGTPGFVAPERQAGAPAGVPGDVWSLARLALWASGADGATADLLAAALAADPRDRPTVEELAALGAALAPPTPVRLPAAADLAQARLRSGGVHRATIAAGRRRDRAAVRVRTGPRGRRPPRARAVPAVVLALSVALGAGGGLAAATPAPPPALLGTPTPRQPDPAAVVASLLERRDAALVAQDAAALARLTVPGGPAAAADAALLAALREGGVHLRGLSTELREVAVVTAGDESLVVEAVLRQGAHSRVTYDGAARSIGVPAQEARCVRLELAGPAPWRVAGTGSCAQG